ncbi:MAG: DUF3501 family protein, partial [Acidimicrobiia bacterium]|nr:DUF3501 family protein [Acidimicrobiia bacterium]
IVTFLFENRETIRFQIQEMARAEKIISDEGIETELAVYNPLIPDPGQLSATMFIELVTDADMREWFPKLVGIETMLDIRVGAGDDADTVRCEVDPAHASQLTRDEMTAAVHYVNWRFTPEQIDRIVAGEPVSLAIDHPAYRYETLLSSECVAELIDDLLGAGTSAQPRP